MSKPEYPATSVEESSSKIELTNTRLFVLDLNKSPKESNGMKFKSVFKALTLLSFMEAIPSKTLSRYVLEEEISKMLKSSVRVSRFLTKSISKEELSLLRTLRFITNATLVLR